MTLNEEQERRKEALREKFVQTLGLCEIDVIGILAGILADKFALDVPEATRDQLVLLFARALAEAVATFVPGGNRAELDAGAPGDEHAS